MDHDPLTSAQAQLLASIRDRANRGEPAPTYRDLCEEFGWASTGTARDHLQALARKGYITLGGGRARQVRLVDSRRAIVCVPMLGRVLAGEPTEAAQFYEGEVAVPLSLITSGPHFALAVEGDSMRDAAIVEGDTLVVREQATAKNGEIVVVTVDGQTTVKRLELRSTGIRLLPENPNYAPIEVGEADLTIHGVVVALIRSLSSIAAFPTRQPIRHIQPPSKSRRHG